MSKISLEKLRRVPESLRDSVSRTRADYRNLGNCGLRVSNPILGALHLGSSRWFPWILDEEKVSIVASLSQTKATPLRLTRVQSLTLLKAAYDSGINTACMFYYFR